MSREALYPIGKGVPSSIGSKGRRWADDDPVRRVNGLQVVSDERGQGEAQRWDVERAVDHARDVERSRGVVSGVL